MKQLFSITKVFLLVGIVALVTGCASTANVTTKPYSSGRVLLMPPRDVVQNGAPHEKGAGSGQELQKYLQDGFNGSAFEIVTTSNGEFSSTAIAPKEKALAEAKKKGAKYVLQVTLGEFQDAAPMTFRPDYVYLDKAVMYDAATGEAVWELASPMYLEKGNIGGYSGLLELHAKAVTKSITANKQ